MKLIFMGTPDFAVPTLEKLINSNHDVCAVFSQPDKPVGRKQIMTPPEVKVCALNAGISVYQPKTLRDEDTQALIRSFNADAIIVVAYGKILPKEVLESAKYCCINVHASLLPKYRGAAPIQWAVLNGDSETGICIQKMALGIDEGDILSMQRWTLTGTETAESLLKEVALHGAISITTILRYIAKHKELPHSTPQRGEASYCSIIKKEDGKINWNHSAEKIDAQIRAYTPWPGCFTSCNGQTLKIIKARDAAKVALQDNSIPKNTAAVPGTVLSYNKQRGILIQTGDGVLIATELQWQAKKAMDYKSFMNGARNFIGSVLE